MSLRLEVGEAYRSRDGRKALILYERDGLYHGTLTGESDKAWRLEGSWGHGGSYKDLVALWEEKKPFDPYKALRERAIKHAATSPWKPAVGQIWANRISCLPMEYYLLVEAGFAEERFTAIDLSDSTCWCAPGSIENVAQGLEYLAPSLLEFLLMQEGLDWVNSERGES